MKKAISRIIPLFLMTLIIIGCGKSTKNSNGTVDSAAVARKSGEKKILYWYDSMTPTIHFDHPGKSPTMDMDLIPMYADQLDNNPNVIKIDPAMVQNIGVVTERVERRKLTRTIHAYGVVMPDEKNISDINTRVGGWIKHLYFDYTGMNVTKGRPMAVIYSPELISAEQEFLQSVNFVMVNQNSVSQSNTLIKSARERLAFFGMNDKQIDELQSSGKVIEQVVIYSPNNGVVLEKNVFEGQKIYSGQSLFRVADLRHVWVLTDVFKIDMPFLKIGSPSTITYNNSASYHGRVDFIYPEVDATARSTKARIPLNNPGIVMKVGQYVTVAIHSSISFDAIAISSQAVINTGIRQVVAVALGEGMYEMRDVKLGAYADGYFEILDGLNEGDMIVTSGQFLIDSDANLKTAGTVMANMPEMSTPSTTTPNVHGQNENKSMENMPGMNMTDKKDSVKSISDSTRREN